MWIKFYIENKNTMWKNLECVLIESNVLGVDEPEKENQKVRNHKSRSYKTFFLRFPIFAV